MIEYDNKLEDMQMTCDMDGCDTVECVGGSWHEAIDELKERGWRVRKSPAGEWWHICPKHKAHSPTE